jgi:hypothetical protein
MRELCGSMEAFEMVGFVCLVAIPCRNSVNGIPSCSKGIFFTHHSTAPGGLIPLSLACSAFEQSRLKMGQEVSVYAADKKRIVIEAI